MVKFSKNMVVFFVAFLVFLIAFCSNKVSPTAGGAGAGNPVTLAVIAKGTDGTNDNQIRNSTENSSGMHDMDDSLSIKDCKGMNVNVTDVYIAAREVYFPIPPNVDIDQIKEQISEDSNTIIINGPYVFNILKGTSEPVLGTINLPDGIYNYAGLYIGPNEDSLLNGFEIVIYGTLKMMMMQTRIIKIYIHSDEKRDFKAINGGIEISQGDSIDLSIELNEQDWLQDIDIKSSSMNGVIQQDSEGNYFIEDDESGVGPASEFCRRIRNNIFNSGVLKKR